MRHFAPNRLTAAKQNNTNIFCYVPKPHKSVVCPPSQAEMILYLSHQVCLDQGTASLNKEAFAS